MKKETREFWLWQVHPVIHGAKRGPYNCLMAKARGWCTLLRRRGALNILNPYSELNQVMRGHILLSFSFECMLAMALHGGSGLLEHPKDSEDDNAVRCCQHLAFAGLATHYPIARYEAGPCGSGVVWSAVSKADYPLISWRCDFQHWKKTFTLVC